MSDYCPKNMLRPVHVFYKDFPDENTRLVAQHPVETWFLPWCPRWMQTLHVVLDTDESGCSIEVKVPYREAILTLGGDFMGYSEEKKKDYMQHEAIHVIHAPFYNWVETAYAPDEVSGYSFYLEMVTEDFKDLIRQITGGRDCDPRTSVSRTSECSDEAED